MNKECEVRKNRKDPGEVSKAEIKEGFVYQVKLGFYPQDKGKISTKKAVGSCWEVRENCKEEPIQTREK